MANHSTETRELAKEEHTAWRRLCLTLANGSVSPEDLDKPVGAGGTAGLAILDAIRAWGEAKARMEISASREAI